MIKNNEQKKLKEILSSNENLRGRMESEKWTLFYNRNSDMVMIGGEFPAGSFYYPVTFKDQDTGVMLRVDKNDKIYGLVIENAKYFIREHKGESIAIALSFVVYPKTSYLIKLPAYFVAYHTLKRINNLRAVFNTTSDYVAGKAAYC